MIGGNIEVLKDQKKNKFKEHRWQILTIVSFIIIVGFILATSLPNSPFTGNLFSGNIISKTFSGDNGNYSGGLGFKSELKTIPELNLDGNFESLYISGGSPESVLNVGSQKVSLGKVKTNFISFDNFNGKINLNKNELSSLEGKIKQITVNGVSMVSVEEGRTTKVNLDKPIKYDSLEILKGVSIDKITYTTSGVLELNGGKQTLNLENDEIEIVGFYGNLKVEKSKLSLDGTVKELNVLGDEKISIGK